MRYSRVRLALIFGLGVLMVLLHIPGQLAAFGEDAESSDLKFILMETQDSPHLLGWGVYDFPPYDSVYGLSLSDRDGDGKHDLLAAGTTLHQFQLNATTGLLTESYIVLDDDSAPEASSFSADWLRTLDLDGDSIEDLIAVTYGGTLRSYRGNGSGYDLVQESTELLPRASRNWLLEATGDGVVDLVVSAKDAGTWIYPGLADGTFSSSPRSSELELAALYVTSGVRNASKGLWMSNHDGLWFYRPDAARAELVTDMLAWMLTAIDIDSDGGPELAFFADGTLSIADTQDGFQIRQQVPIPFYPMEIVTGDFDGNGDSDIAILAPASHYEYAVLLNHDGRIDDTPWLRGVTRVEGVDQGVQNIVAGDFDGDGIDDLAFGLTHSVSFAVSRAGWRLVQPLDGMFILGSAPNGLLVSDSLYGIAQLTHVGGGRFSKILRTTGLDEPWAGNVPFLACLSDVDDHVPGDEIVAMSLSNGGGFVGVWERNGNGWSLAWIASIAGTMRPILLTADLFGDGIEEIVVAEGEDLVVLQPPTRGAVEDPAVPVARLRSVDWGGPVGPLVVTPAGNVENIIGFSVSEESVKLQRLSGFAVTPLEASMSVAPLDLMAVDADQDGRMDLAVAGLGIVNSTSEQAHLAVYAGLLYGTDATQFQGDLEPIQGWPPNAMIFPYGGLSVGDLTGDGLLDLAMTRLGGESPTPGNIYLLLGEANGGRIALQSHRDVGTRLLAIDLDGDGSEELVYATQGSPAFLSVLRLKGGSE